MRRLLRNTFYVRSIAIGIVSCLYGIIQWVSAAYFCFCLTCRVLADIASGASLAENGHNEKCGDYFFHTSNVY